MHLFSWYRRQRRIVKIGIGCPVSIFLILVLLYIIGTIAGPRSSAQSTTAATITQKPISISTQKPTPTQRPTPQSYPPKTLADLRSLAAQGTASAVHEFHSDDTGLTGACPQPKREATVDSGVTGQQFAEDLLAYFYSQHLDSPCGSIVFAYHSQDDEANGAYTAGRVDFNTTDASGVSNVDPNATNLKHTLTLDVGDVATGQESIVTY